MWKMVARERPKELRSAHAAARAARCANRGPRYWRLSFSHDDAQH